VNAISIPLASTPYSERKMRAALHLAPRIAVATADAYVSTVTAAAVPLASAQPLVAGAFGQQLTSTAQAVGGALPLVNGLLVAGHAISAAVLFFGDGPYNASEAYHKARKVMGVGELITAVGYVGQACGFGLWALPVTAIGIATTVVGQYSESRNL